jgi:hypothetical protein
LVRIASPSFLVENPRRLKKDRLNVVMYGDKPIEGSEELAMSQVYFRKPRGFSILFMV